MRFIYGLIVTASFLSGLALGFIEGLRHAETLWR